MGSADENLGGLRRAAERIVESHGLALFDLQFRRESIGWVLRVMVDRVPGEVAGPDGSAAPTLAVRGGAAESESGVTVDDCQRVSTDLGTLLDVEPDLIPPSARSYTLEVSSPGLDRPLRGEADYRRFRGRLAKIVTSEPVGGQTSFAGRLAGVQDGAVLLTEGRRTHRVPLPLVRRARLEVEF